MSPPFEKLAPWSVLNTWGISCNKWHSAGKILVVPLFDLAPCVLHYGEDQDCPLQMNITQPNLVFFTSVYQRRLAQHGWNLSAWLWPSVSCYWGPYKCFLFIMQIMNLTNTICTPLTIHLENIHKISLKLWNQTVSRCLVIPWMSPNDSSSWVIFCHRRISMYY